MTEDDTNPTKQAVTDQPGRTVTIAFREYMSLFKASATLDELIDAGVDNWSGYDNVDRDRIAAVCRAERNRHIHGEGTR